MNIQIDNKRKAMTVFSRESFSIRERESPAVSSL